MFLSILVVEEDGLIRMDLVDTSSDAGYAVLAAGNAGQALTILGNNHVVALPGDIEMPGTINAIGLARLTS